MIIASSRARSAFHLICVVAIGIVAATTTAGAQEAFKTPAEAATALIEAARGSEEKRMRAVLGIVGRDSLHSGDDVADAADRAGFLAAFDGRHSINVQGDRATLIVGPDDFPFPIPIMRRGNAWKFDGVSGRDEILARRIGRNELAAIQASLAFFDAQQEYATKDRTGQGAGVYAQRIVSRAGAKDGLYWNSAAGEEPSPLGELAAEAAAEGYKAGETRRPFHGYYYQVLRRQGPSAPGGAIDYVAGGKMIGGFALLAYPAEYGRSGLMSFMLNHAGTVYQKDLGPGTNRIAARMQSFNPDKGWEKVSTNRAD
jgi:hypothetical protein